MTTETQEEREELDSIGMVIDLNRANQVRLNDQQLEQSKRAKATAFYRTVESYND